MIKKENKIFVIDKPKNLTSNQVIQIIRKQTNIKKIGHGGTLDPLATGVLIIGIDEGTKLLNHHLNIDNKIYEAIIKFGISTDTYDIQGNIVNQSHKKIDVDEVSKFCEFIKNNEYYQEVPIYSAVKVNGMELYKYARKNITPASIPKKLVKLLNYEIYECNDDFLKIKLEVSKGFYIRSFVNDLAKYINADATLFDLIRLSSGNYSISDALSIDDFIKFYNNN